MKYTELYHLYKALDKHTEQELIEAVKAHGGEYIFIHLNEKNEVKDKKELHGAPIILCSHRHAECYEDHRISRVTVVKIGNSEHLHVYGWPLDPDWPDEYEVEMFIHGQLSYVLDAIPETEEVKDVSIPIGMYWNL